MIVGSRWVETYKEDGRRQSRWVMWGYGDQAILELEHVSPTLSMLGLMLILQLCASMVWLVFVMDIECAFNQGRQTRREIYASAPRSGWWGQRPSTILARLLKTIYGLVDGPLEFFKSLETALRENNFYQLELEPCVFVYFQAGTVTGVLGAEVDDLIGGGTPQFEKAVLKHIEDRFQFRKKEPACQDGGARFCGRTVFQKASGEITTSMKDYSDELQTLSFGEKGTKDKKRVLDPRELTQYRGGVGALNWLQSQGRPDMAGRVIPLQRALAAPTVAEALELNATLEEARQHGGVEIRILPIPAREVIFAEIGDAALRHDDERKCQGGWLIAATTPRLLQGMSAPWSVLAWAAHSIKRVVNSSLAAEVAVQVEGVGVPTWVRVVWEAMTSPKFDLYNWKELIEKRASVAITDCRSLFDHVTSYKGVTTSCKRTGIDLAILKQDFCCTDGSPNQVKWVATKQMMVDCMTKKMASDLLRVVLRDASYTIVADDGIVLKTACEADRAKERRREQRAKKSNKKKNSTGTTKSMDDGKQHQKGQDGS